MSNSPLSSAFSPSSSASAFSRLSRHLIWQPKRLVVEDLNSEDFDFDGDFLSASDFEAQLDSWERLWDELD